MRGKKRRHEGESSNNSCDKRVKGSQIGGGSTEARLEAPTRKSLLTRESIFEHLYKDSEIVDENFTLFDFQKSTGRVVQSFKIASKTPSDIDYKNEVEKYKGILKQVLESVLQQQKSVKLGECLKKLETICKNGRQFRKPGRNL